MRQSSNFESKQLPNTNQCSIGDTDSKNLNILFVGDSHARSEVPMLSVWLKDINQKAYVVSQKTTPFLYDFENVIEGVSVTDRNDSIKKLIKSKKYKYVILDGEWSNAIYSKYLPSIKKSVELIIDNGAIPIIILDTPTLSINLDKLCPLQEQNLPYLFGKHSCQLSASFVTQQQQNFDRIIFDLKKSHPDMIVINPRKALCNDKYCNIEINGTPIYSDSNHLNFVGSELLGKKYLKEYGNPLTSLKNKGSSKNSVHAD